MKERQIVFITGGTGLVGVPLIFKLLETGYFVKALYRSEKARDKFRMLLGYYTNTVDEIYSKIEWIKGDILDKQLLEEVIEENDFVVHAAAFVSFKKKDKKRIKTINIKGTENLVDVSLHRKAKRFIHISSIAAIDCKSSEELCDEKSFPSHFNSIYASSKTKAEFEVWRGFEEGLKGTVVNPAVIIGPGNWKEGSSKIFKTIDKGLLYYTEGITGYVDVRDVAECVVYLVNLGITNERFILSSENLSYRELITKVASSLGKKVPTKKVSERFIQLIRLLTFNTIVTKEMANSASNVSRYSAEKMIKLWGKEFRRIDEAVEFTSGCFESGGRKPAS